MRACAACAIFAVALSGCLALSGLDKEYEYAETSTDAAGSAGAAQGGQGGQSGQSGQSGGQAGQGAQAGSTSQGGTGAGVRQLEGTARPRTHPGAAPWSALRPVDRILAVRLPEPTDGPPVFSGHTVVGAAVAATEVRLRSDGPRRACGAPSPGYGGRRPVRR